MENRKYISVIIPCYNSMKYIDRCMNSVINQTIGIENLEIILVNDASTDDTYTKLLEYEKMFPESILVINCTENMRQGGARNIALQYATGEYLAFLDSDDWLDINAYNELYQLVTKFDFDIIQFNHYNVNGGQMQLVETVKEMKILYLNDIDTRKNFLVNSVMTAGCWNKLYKMELVKKVEPKYIEHCIYEEPPFVYLLFFFANKVCCLPKTYHFCYINPEGTMQNDTKEPGRLLDHPKSQKFLLEEIKLYPEIMKIYHDEIEWYFLHTYYFETLYFAGLGNLCLTESDFYEMQKYALSQFPTWDSNIYINRMPLLKQVLETMEMEMYQEHIDSICMQLKNLSTK